MTTIIGDIPLYYDATNEFCLSMAGLNFTGNAYYEEDELSSVSQSFHLLNSVENILYRYKKNNINV